jgi:hypothetical protein
MLRFEQINGIRSTAGVVNRGTINCYDLLHYLTLRNFMDQSQSSSLATREVLALPPVIPPTRNPCSSKLPSPLTSPRSLSETMKLYSGPS